MAFCSNCGSQAQGAFCPNCGSAIGSGTASSSSAFTPPTTVTTGGLEPHIASALCYAPFAIGLVASIIFLLVAPYNQNKFVRFSAFQSLFLHLASFLLFMLLGALAPLHLLGLLFVSLIPLVWVAIVVLFLYLMYKSFNNQKVVLPYIGELAGKQA